jgi:hypothetical protein
VSEQPTDIPTDIPTEIPADIPADAPTIDPTPEQEAPVAETTIAIGAIVRDEHDRNGIYLGKDDAGNQLVAWLPEPTATTLELDVLA